jgi:tetratricopeptide (TPR) repeat protein
MRVVWLTAEDLRSLERVYEDFLVRGYKLVFLASTRVGEDLQILCPKFIAACTATTTCPPLVPAFAVAGMLEAARAPGIEWRGGPLIETLQAAFPGQKIVWASARMPYDEILKQCWEARGAWLCWTDVDGPFRLRRVRWALAESVRVRRNVIVEPRESVPGWWPLHGRVLQVEEAIRRLEAAGSCRAGLLGVLSGLEPGGIELLENALRKGIHEDDLLLALRDDGDGGVTLGRIALDHGLLAVDEVVAMTAPPTCLRALARHASIEAMRRRCRDTVRAELLAGEPTDEAALAAWAASARTRLPLELLDHSPTSAQGWIAEVLLRGAPTDTDTWRALADAAIRLGDFTVAVHWADKALAIENADPLVVARAHFTRARASFHLGAYAEAEERARTCLALREEAVGRNHIDTASTLHVIGQALSRQGKHIKALAAFTRAHTIEKQVLGPEHPDTAITLHAIGQVMSNLNRFHEALDAFNQALAIKEATIGPDHPSTASTLHALGQVLARQGKHAEALAAFTKDLSITEKSLGPEHPSTAVTLNALGQTLALMDRHEEALRCFAREIPIVEKSLGSQHLDLAAVHDAMGQTLSRLGRLAEAAQTFLRSLKIKEKALGPDHLDVAFTQHALAQVQAASGNLGAAMDAYEKALAIRRKILGPDHQLVGVTLHAIAQLQVRRGRLQDAIRTFDTALAIKEASLGPEHPETAVTRFERGRALRDAGDPSGVAQMMGAASLLERILGKDHPHVLAARKLLR